MGLKDLKKLVQKENLLFLFLILWLILGLTFLQFNLSFTVFGVIIDGIFIYYPLLIICTILFIIAFFFRGDLKKLNLRTILKGIFLLVVMAIVLMFLGLDILLAIAYGAFIVSTIFYIFITATFTMYYCYQYGISLDDTLYKAPKPISFLVRWGIFLIGTLGAILLIYYIGNISLGTAENDLRIAISEQLSFLVDFVLYVPIVIIAVIIVLFVVAVIYIFKGKLNAWLGIFFLFISIYASVLMIQAFLGGDVTTISPLLDTPYTYIVLFIFDIIVLLITISNLIGKKAELITQKIKFIKPDAILIFLILCKVAFEFANSQFLERQLLNTNVELLKYVGVFGLFIPLLLIAGLNGIFSYGKLKEQRKLMLEKKKSDKKFRKTAAKEKKNKEKAKKKAEKEATRKKFKEY
ncbi:MAG: hypothetical protein ACTSRI_05750 [Promethearchaeota archaeon]